MLSVSLTLWIVASLEQRFQLSKHKHSRRMYNKRMSKTNGCPTTIDHQYDNNCPLWRFLSSHHFNNFQRLCIAPTLILND